MNNYAVKAYRVKLSKSGCITYMTAIDTASLGYDEMIRRLKVRFCWFDVNIEG